MCRSGPVRVRGQAGQRLRRTAAMAVGVVAAGVLVAPGASGASAAGTDSVQRGLDRLVRTDGVPAALASVRGAGQRDRERTRDYTAGVGDLATGAAVPRDGQVRIGSNTKAFTAVVVLQLVAEGKIRLDDPVEKYLPGLVRGDGIDGRKIKVRHLLQQTSGLPNYTKGDLQPRYYEPRELLDIALEYEADFAPGKDWAYSNTNYVLAGMIVEKVTKHTIAEEIDRRIVKRLGLRHTYFPAPRDATIREPHPKGYLQEAPGAPLRDITELDPSWTWAAGQLISTNSDVNRFYAALLTPGRLLPKPQLDQMRTTVRADYFGKGARYGLGIVSRPLSCGGLYWGHGGSYPGYETRGGATDDGRAANVAVTVQPTDEAVMSHVDEVVDTALCRRR
ncbi:serine hydrolase domain-containing protein [Streptomyces venezuelae]|uniref:Serine hydrolase n=2 Tax=Streptomyces TaxID=1883 RepID=A0A5P2BF55_STRVZ|nr:serine hydrolase [Streptomyces sp. SID335]MYZ15426.1 serine hydrolase [Streptomyces sp. SID337]NDZ86628.1 beta-lactamase family protein [Streptomyces sp. SID10115]NEA06253.1 beta-lactamase family protein [Streptomyces sp. SID10116]NEB48855.1 beta-lactamase family protein [Streptomyces sp. SID339]QES28976.1 serine hydrolase [Streptomyces venezuelae]